MKLYTQEQVIEMLNMHVEYNYTYPNADSILSDYTPIELPTDEEIFKQSIKEMEEWYGSDCKEEIDSHFRGAKWMQKRMFNKGGEQ